MSEKLQEATIMALQGKLEEGNMVDFYRNELKEIQNNYKNIKTGTDAYRYNYKREKNCLIDLKKALSNEKGTFVSAASLSKEIQKLADVKKYTDKTTGVRGFHSGGKGDFTIDTDVFKNNTSEDTLFYDIDFIGNDVEEKIDIIKNALTENGYNVEYAGPSGLRVSCYKTK